MSIARNSALQRLRRAKNVESLDEGAYNDEEDFRPRQVRAWQDNPEQFYSKSEIRQLVERGILALPANYRAVVMLRDIQQLSTDESPQQLGLKRTYREDAAAERPVNAPRVALASLYS